MSKKSLQIGCMVLLIMTLAWNPLLTKEVKFLKKVCCITGKYEGFYKDKLSLTCKEPQSGVFTMVINQEKKCGGKIWGTVTSEDGTVQEFKGTVSATKKGCCKIQGVVRMKTTEKPLMTKQPIKEVKPPEEAKIEGIMCKKKGKWVLEKGTYKTSRGCAGTFNMKQV